MHNFSVHCRINAGFTAPDLRLMQFNWRLTVECSNQWQVNSVSSECELHVFQETTSILHPASIDSRIGAVNFQFYFISESINTGKLPCVLQKIEFYSRLLSCWHSLQYYILRYTSWPITKPPFYFIYLWYCSVPVVLFLWEYGAYKTIDWNECGERRQWVKGHLVNDHIRSAKCCWGLL